MHVASWNFRVSDAKMESESRNFVGGEVQVSNSGGKRGPRLKELAAMDSDGHVEVGEEFFGAVQRHRGAMKNVAFFGHGLARR